MQVSSENRDSGLPETTALLAGMIGRAGFWAGSIAWFAIAWVGACLASGPSLAAEHLPRSMLVLEQSDVRGPFYAAIFSGLRSEVNANATSPVTIYVENLDLNRFTGPEYEQGLRAFLDVKYKNVRHRRL
jgi:hypothetical protein